MKINISAGNCFTVDTMWFDLMYIRKREHKIDPCTAVHPKRRGKIKLEDVIGILTLSLL